MDFIDKDIDKVFRMEPDSGGVIEIDRNHLAITKSLHLIASPVAEDLLREKGNDEFEIIRKPQLIPGAGIIIVVLDVDQRGFAGNKLRVRERGFDLTVFLLAGVELLIIELFERVEGVDFCVKVKQIRFLYRSLPF